MTGKLSLASSLSIAALIIAGLASQPALRADLVYSHTFDGLSTDDLNGSAVDFGSANWTASATAKADGTDSALSSAWLPYAFGTGVYTLTASIDVSALASNSNSFAGISFTNNASFYTGDFVGSSAGAYSSIGLRGTSNWDFWAGIGNQNSVDGGTTSFPRVNTLKLVLDTTKANWEVTASLLDAGSNEVWLDLAPSDSGSMAYTYTTNPDTFTGVGILIRSSDAKIDAFTFSAETSTIPEPSAFAMLLGLGSLGAVSLRRRRVG